MALLTVADAKAQLNIAVVTYDAELQVYCDAVVELVEDKVGAVDNRSASDIVGAAGGGMALLLPTTPVVSLTSMVSIYDSSVYDVTSLYVEDPDSGVVRRKTGVPIGGRGPWTITYVAGRGSVPPALNLAARIIVAHLWETQRGRAGGRGPSANSELSVVPAGYAVPNRAKELLAPFEVAA